jgi:hypothetical protein
MLEDQAAVGHLPRTRTSPAYTSGPVNLVGHGNPHRLDASFVTPDLFSILGVGAAHGRALLDVDSDARRRSVKGNGCAS